MKNDALLRIDDLHTHFYTDEGLVKAADGIDITIGSGDTLGLVGESGCGKSVTALSIMRLIQEPPGRIVKGEVLFHDLNLLKLSEREMEHIRGNRISMIFQEPMTSLNPLFRAGDQIAEAIHLHQKVSKAEAKRRAVQMLQKVGIPDPEKRAKEYPHQMSGGMRQRVMIAMALSCNPELMIADEPTTALDVSIQAQILELMNNLKEDFGASILLITHDLGVIAEMAQTVAVMYAGKIVEYVDVVRLFDNPRHPYTSGLMDSIPKMDDAVPEDKMLRTIPGVVPSLYDLPTGCYFQPRCSLSSDVCFEKVPPLLEIEPGHLLRCWKYE
ncbi:MAG: ABC transporter ATP-binding protein [Deltaproteobacteria bacterium]|nr:ABC transporter ATP-binding protein [Deltaproteobacteria bacterium]MBW2153369.1 ABC transporter ATP-binding protein [Deltaproteobacteria bacterium]